MPQWIFPASGACSITSAINRGYLEQVRMSYYLSKVLPQFLMPVPVSLLLGLVALVLVLRGWRKPAIASLLAAIGLLWVSALPPVASALLWTLQKQHPPVELDSIPRSDCIIVLGGVLGDAEYPRVDIELSEAVDRVYQSARLFRTGKGRNIIVAAGNQPWAADREPEAGLIRNLLVEWGVPAASIRLDTSSRNTRENAVNGAALIREARCKSNLLVTSAWHMPRAVAAFARVGIEVFAVSVDVKGVQGRNNLALWLTPRVEALAVTSQALMEWMGILVYRWRGWA